MNELILHTALIKMKLFLRRTFLEDNTNIYRYSCKKSRLGVINHDAKCIKMELTRKYDNKTCNGKTYLRSVKSKGKFYCIFLTFSIKVLLSVSNHLKLTLWQCYHCTTSIYVHCI